MENKGFIIINLLPYRDKIKKDKLRQFGLLLALFVLAAGSIIFSGHTFLSLKISGQESRNKYIEVQNENLDKQIKEIVNLKDEIKETLAKRQVVEGLQLNRSDTVTILNEISKQLPEGVVLKNVKQVLDKITVVGVTQSNAKVSNYMSNLEQTKIFENAQLVEVKLLPIVAKTTTNKTVSNDVRLSEFSLTVDLKKKLELKEEKNKKIDSKSKAAEIAKDKQITTVEKK